MAGSTLSRRVSEFFGVALFAAALIWLIALATYEPTDPVWFFSAGSGAQPANFAGRVGAFLAELSFQLLGYASYLIPAAMVVLGWHYFWCRTLDAQYTKLVGAGLLFGCVSSLLSLAFGSVDVAGKPFRAGGYLGEWLASWMAEYLNRTGSIIVILTLLFLAIVLSTQFSLGRMFSSATRVSRSGGSRMFGALRSWLDERRRARQRKALLAKQAKKAEKPAPVVAAPKEPAEIPVRPSRCQSKPTDYRPRNAGRPSWRNGRRRSRIRRSRCPTRNRGSRGATARSRFRRCRCSTRRKPSARSTSAS